MLPKIAVDQNTAPFKLPKGLLSITEFDSSAKIFRRHIFFDAPEFLEMSNQTPITPVSPQQSSPDFWNSASFIGINFFYVCRLDNDVKFVSVVLDKLWA